MNTDERTCPECDGTGLAHTSEHFWQEDVCKTCEGEGVITKQFGQEKLTREELNRP